MTTRKCDFCAGITHPYPKQGLCCESCNSIMAEKVPNDEDLVQFYDSFLDSYHGGGRQENAESRQIKWAQAYLSLVKRYSKNGRSLLDVGAANNPLPALASNSFDVTTMDLKLPRELAPNVEYLEGSITDEIVLSRQFDIVTCFAVLEHVNNPEKAIENLLRLTKPGGFVIISTPLAGSLAEKYGPGYSPWFFPPEHLFLFSHSALKTLFRRNGGELVYIGTFDYNQLRKSVRRALVMMEAAFGIILRFVAKNIWFRKRESRTTKNFAITVAVFKKGE